MLHSDLHDERHLFTRLAGGDKEAFRQVFDQYNGKLAAFIFKLTKSESIAAELAQDVFVKLWINRSHLDGVANPHAYIFTMASNRTIDHLRKVASETKMLSDLWLRISGSQDRTEETYNAKECQQLINQAVVQLSPQKQAIFRLSRYEGLKHEEIAAYLSVSKSTVKNHLVETLRHIRSYLHQHSKTLMFILSLYWF